MRWKGTRGEARQEQVERNRHDTRADKREDGGRTYIRRRDEAESAAVSGGPKDETTEPG